MQVSDLVYDVRPDVPGAPDFVIKDAIRKAAVDFFYESQCWMEPLDPIPLVSGTYRYDLLLPTDAILLRLYSDGRYSGVKIGRCDLRVVPDWQLFDITTNSVDVGEPRCCAIVSTDDSIIVHPTPGASEAGKSLSVFAVLGVVREVETINDTIGARWRAAIISGAKAKLMNTAGKAWSNPLQGAMEAAEYRRKMTSARTEGHTGRYAGPRMVQFRPLA